MAYDHYAEASRLAKLLAEEGHGEWTRRIEAVIAEGATANEILMGLRWQLERLARSDVALSHEAADESKLLLRELKRVLA